MLHAGFIITVIHLHLSKASTNSDASHTYRYKHRDAEKKNPQQTNMMSNESIPSASSATDEEIGGGSSAAAVSSSSSLKHRSTTTATSTSPGSNGNAARLSKVSKQYDVNGDGRLDSTEMAMRQLDVEGRGYLTNDKVYKLMQEQLKMQKDLLNFKRITIFLVIFAVVLALANLGTAFAAATLAKDTTTSNGVLVVQGNENQAVATNGHEEVFHVLPPLQQQNQRRRMEDFNISLSSTPSATMERSAAQEAYSKCIAGNTVAFTRNYSDRNLEQTIQICPSTRSKLDFDTYEEYHYTNVPHDGGDVLVNCSKVDDSSCNVTGSALLLDIGDPCYWDEECETNSCFNQNEGSLGTCQCNTVTRAGCTSSAGAATTCAHPDAIEIAQGTSIGRSLTVPTCMLLSGATCTNSAECLSNNCANGVCMCNTATNYPCPASTQCLQDGGAYFCKDGPDGCPVPYFLSPCFRILLQVECTGGCVYGNQCVAESTGLQSTDCNDLNKDSGVIW